MSTSGKRAVVMAVLGVCFGAGVLIVAGGVFAAEGALHPARRAVAPVCPCFSHVHCESVSITARDGVTLRAWFYTPEKPNGGAVILLHGVASNRQDMLALGYLFLRRGYAVLEPDLRGHGESGGFTTYGVLEEGDTSAWVDWLGSGGRATRLYGFGASLGAAVLLESLKHETRFRAVVAESAYYDFPSVARERIGRMLPPLLRPVATPLVAAGLAWTRLRHCVDLRTASPADGLRMTRVPVLLIHGLADQKTSPENSRRLAAIDPAASLWLVAASGHADAWATAGAEFEARVTGWLNSH